MDEFVRSFGPMSFGLKPESGFVCVSVKSQTGRHPELAKSLPLSAPEPYPVWTAGRSRFLPRSIHQSSRPFLASTRTLLSRWSRVAQKTASRLLIDRRVIS